MRRGWGYGVVSGLLALGLGSVCAADLKMAVVDVDQLMQTYYKTGLVKSHMEEQKTDFTAEGEKMLEQRRKMKKEFESLRGDAFNAALSEEAQEKRVRMAEDKLLELMEYESRIRETAQTRRQQLEEERERMIKQLSDDIRQTIRDYANKAGYDLVLDSSSPSPAVFSPVIYAPVAKDITEEIQKLLNKGKPEGKIEGKPAAPKAGPSVVE